MEPLAAAQDFNVFVPMMMRKNIELQLQALQMIEFMCGLIPAVLQIEDGETLRNRKELSPEDTERYVLISVLRQSRDEFEAMQKGREEMEFLAKEGEQQRMRLEDEIRKEERLLQIALANQKSAKEETPLSIAAIMFSRMTDNSTNTEEQGTSESSSRGRSINRDYQNIGTDARPISRKQRTNSSSNTENQQNLGKRDDSAEPRKISGDQNIEDLKIEKSEISTNTSNVSNDFEDSKEDKNFQTSETSKREIGTDARPISGKHGIRSTSRPGTAKRRDSKGTATEVTQNRPTTGKRKNSQGTLTDSTIETNNYEDDLESINIKKQQNSGISENEKRPETSKKSNQIENKTIEMEETEENTKKRPVTGKRRGSKNIQTDKNSEKIRSSKETGTGTDYENMEENKNDKSTSRPSTVRRNSSKDKVESEEKETATKTRPATGKQKSSSDSGSTKDIGTETAGKQKEDRPRTKSKTRELPPKGPVKEPRYANEKEQKRYVETPGMEHGPRRKNLNDVNSHLVDRDRLNSSDVRARAEYLREQRDRLLQLKRDERIKQMNELTKDSLDRPKTAKAARGMMDKKEADDIRREINQKIKTDILTLQ
ncbi:unnamed protein product [Caenorhabditis angaria]|uniref:Coiled-coil domain-containing protein 104 n=1 Tax=Caenorhabditis angaria TaxID=860376 RepID=A0A9P1N4J0_9PELO|nr:unnamed protein product [Caenorhabditis angaria]